MKKLEEDLKNGNFKNVYLLYGNQAYLRNQYRDKIIKALIPSGDTMNVNRYDGTNLPVEEIIDLAETMPFLSDYRVIVIENSGIFKDGNSKLENYIPDMCETTCIIFSEEEVDGRLKLTKTVKSKGSAVAFEKVAESDINKWVLGKISREHKSITNDAYEYFIKSCGEDMFKISTELDKLLSYTYNKNSITISDVKDICTAPIEDTVFDMLDAMFRGDSDKAFSYYGDLLGLFVAPMKTLALIQGQIRLLYHEKCLSEDGLSYSDIAKSLGVHEYRVKKSLPQAKKSSKIWLRKGMELCADVERRFKSGEVDAQIGLETVICTLSGLTKS